MTVQTPPLPVQTPIASELEVGKLEDALQRGCRRLRFEPAVEASYERDTGPARTLRHAIYAALGAGSFWLLTVPQAAQRPEIATLLTAARWATMAACVSAMALLFVFRASMKGWQRETLTALGTLAVVAYTNLCAAHLNTMPVVMQLSTPLLIMLHASIGARMQCRLALAVNLATSLGYAAVAHGDSWEARQVVLNHMLLFVSGLVFGTVGNYLLEYRERRGYLLQCLSAKRHDTLLVDADILRRLALRDGLTNLYNRRHFDAEVERAWHAGLQGRHAIGMLQVDVDHFKAYNDRYGHPAGDRVLTQVAAALQGAAERAGGIAARVGGEEFALLLPDLAGTDLDAVATDVCRSVRGLALPHAGSKCAARVTVSVGAAAVQPAPGLTASALIATADAALYTAKRQGRDRSARGEVQPELSTPSRVRLNGDSLSPGTQVSDDPQHLIDRLSPLLTRSLARLRFPADLETEFQDRGADVRRGKTALLVIAGLTTILYVWLCAPVLGDVADLLRDRTIAVCVVSWVALWATRRIRHWRVQEGIVSAIISGMAMTIIRTESLGTAPTIYTAALGLCLLPLFSSMVVAQPLRFSLVPSLLICVGIATQMAPAQVERQPIWLYTLGVVWIATFYTLLGGYLLERSSRRGYLLYRLREAQIAVLRHNTEHLQRLATLDPLTRLPNRRHFEAELERLTAVCLATRQPLALLILDIDHFKPYNDGYGHPAGDACLQHIGAALGQWAGSGGLQPTGAVPARIGGEEFGLQHIGAALGQWAGSGGLQPTGAVPARIGGEEFGVLLPNTDSSAALATAQRLRILLGELRIEHAHSPVGRFLTVSIGSASRVLGSAADTRLLLQSADAALYRAKGLGRDQAAA